MATGIAAVKIENSPHHSHRPSHFISFDTAGGNVVLQIMTKRPRRGTPYLSISSKEIALMCQGDAPLPSEIAKINSCVDGTPLQAVARLDRVVGEDPTYVLVSREGMVTRDVIENVLGTAFPYAKKVFVSIRRGDRIQIDDKLYVFYCVHIPSHRKKDSQ